METRATSSVTANTADPMSSAVATTDPAHHTTTSHLDVTPTTSKVWYIIVDQNNIRVGEPSRVISGQYDDVLDSKVKIKEGEHREYLTNVNIGDIEVWKCASLILRDDVLLDDIDGLIGNNFPSSDARKLNSWNKVKSLWLHDCEALLVTVQQKGT